MNKFNSLSTKLRFEFIGMAFALAIAQVGIEIGDFYSHGKSLREFPYVLSHLSCGTYIIASSWVGWNKSKSKGNLEEINNTFGRPFILLLLDLFLVICYFIMVKGVEKPYGQNSLSISASFEVIWAIIIMSTYGIWDIFTKLIDFNSANFQLRFQWKIYFQRAYQAFICLVLLGLIFLSINIEDEISKSNVVLIDIYLILVFVLFRGMKEKISNPDKHFMVKRLKYFFYINLPLLGIIFLYFIIFLTPFF